eukprot:COSAG01_NODE_3354_length_6215_cov_299.344016_5_plen_92_part_00
MSPANKIVVSRSRGQLPPEIEQDWQAFTHTEEVRQALREQPPEGTAEIRPQMGSGRRSRYKPIHPQLPRGATVYRRPQMAEEGTPANAEAV